MNSIRARVRSRTIITPAIEAALDSLIKERPCALVRIAFENSMFVSKSDEWYFFNEESWPTFLQREVSQLHPFIKAHAEDQIWLEFFEKYALMSKEYLVNCLRNTSRQHRGAKRFSKDFMILIAEGNFTDETLLAQKNFEVKKHNTVGLLVSIRLTLAHMIRFMNYVFTLEMARVEELPALLMQTGYIYQVSWANQQPTVLQHFADLADQGLVSFENFADSHDKVLQRRQSLPESLKLYCDQLDYFAAMHEMFKGLRRFTQVCELVGIIKPLPRGSAKLLY